MSDLILKAVDLVLEREIAAQRTQAAKVANAVRKVGVDGVMLMPAPPQVCNAMSVSSVI